jgi:membrane protein implicated in regulation of membrane protease activity
MVNAFANLNGFEIFFLLCAIVGGFFVLVKLIMQFIGADAEIDTDLDAGIDAQHVDSDIGFKVLSMHSLTSFLMMFGLVGLALYRQSQVGIFLSTLGASVAGLASVWVIGRIFASVGRLQSSGTLATASAVGSTGTVYLGIPQGGTGRVSINFRGRLREFDASAADGEAIATGTPVRVVRVDASVLIVEKIR